MTDAGIPSSEIDGALAQARAHEYALLATLLAHRPEPALMDRLARLSGDATPLGRAHAALGRAADRVGAVLAAREYHALFVGLGRGELLPYASYYLTGFLQGRPLARLRSELQHLGMVRAAEQVEPEDHAAAVLEIMAGLTDGSIAASAATKRRMFEEYVACWMPRFFTDLERASSAQFYASVGTAGRTFLAIEAEAHALSGGF